MKKKQQFYWLRQLKNENFLSRLLLVSSDEGSDDDLFLAMLEECGRRGIRFEGIEIFDDDCPLCLMEKKQLVFRSLSGQRKNPGFSGFVAWTDAEDGEDVSGLVH